MCNYLLFCRVMGQKHKSYYLFNNLAGNTTTHDHFQEGCSRQMCWDRENHLVSFSDHCKNTGFYQYDAGGEEFNPIISIEGKLLGTDNNGWMGTPIVMDKKDFKKGMKHEDALKKGTELDKYGKGIKISDKDWKTVEENGGKRMSPYVENHSGETIYFKPETTYGEYKNEGAYPLEAGKELDMPVDGVATSKYNDNVGKIPTGATIKITKEGGLNIDFHGFGGLVRLFPDYGWVNKKWQRKQQKAGDHSWNKLFEIAGQIGRRPY